MSSWKDSLEDFKEEYALFLKKRYDDFDINSIEEALEHWVSLAEMAEMIMEDLNSRLDELSSNYEE